MGTKIHHVCDVRLRIPPYLDFSRNFSGIVVTIFEHRSGSIATADQKAEARRMERESYASAESRQGREKRQKTGKQGQEEAKQRWENRLRRRKRTLSWRIENRGEHAWCLPSVSLPSNATPCMLGSPTLATCRCRAATVFTYTYITFEAAPQGRGDVSDDGDVPIIKAG